LSKSLYVEGILHRCIMSTLKDLLLIEQAALVKLLHLLT
jgi:hypothetical protein